MRNKISTYIIITTLVMALLVSTGKATSVSALAVGPLADPVYDTEILAFKEYVEQNLDEPQLDIMFFLIGGLAVAQMGAQDAMLISPYPNEESVKEWIINCGIQLYNTVIGLVPEGDYYIGVGLAYTKGIPRQTIKALVAQMMGDAVVAINYPDLDTFLEENPNELYLPFNRELQIGVNAVFGLGGGLGTWQNSTDIDASFTWNYVNLTSSAQDHYNAYVANYDYHTLFNGTGRFYNNSNWPNYALNGQMNFETSVFNRFHDIFINPGNHSYEFYDDNGITLSSYLTFPFSFVTAITSGSTVIDGNFTRGNSGGSYSSSLSKEDVIRNIYNGSLRYLYLYAVNWHDIFISTPALLAQGIDFDFYYGTDWAHRIQFEVTSDLNLDNNDMSAYYNQLTSDYLFDLRGLMGDLVNYVYLNPIWDNIYDLVGNLVVPDRVKVSVDLTPITDLLEPPIPVNLNDVALYTDNDYIEEIKDRGRKFGEVIGQYIIFWHNSDPATCYILLGGSVVVLLSAFIGKWGHS